MKIQYLGHSSFLLEESTGTTIITDPFDGIGYEMPLRRADIVTVSHGHHDHDSIKSVDGNPQVIAEEGTYEVSGVDITAIPTYHDGEEGSLRGNNLVFKFRMDGLDICHLGDIGEECNSDLLEMILPVDILLIPVGGNYTIDAEQAKEYVDRIMPEIVSPMHYKTKSCNVDIDRVDDFTHQFDSEEVEKTDAPYLEFDREDLTGESTKVIVMKRVRE